MIKTQSFNQLSLTLILIFLANVNCQTLEDIKSQIVNNWKSIALELGPQQSTSGVVPGYKRREFNFTSDLVFSAFIQDFADKSGSIKKMTAQGSGSITFQSESTFIAGAFLCQFSFDQSMSITIHTDEVVAYFNSLQNGDITWVKDQPQDVMKKSVPAMGLKANEFFIAYDIIYIKDDYLYMGMIDAFGSDPSPTNPPQGLQVPLIPFDSDVTPLTIDELKSEIIPAQNFDGSLTTFIITRQITFPTDSTHKIIINRYPGAGQTDSLIEFETSGHLVWEGDASEVVSGAQFVQFVRDEFYVTPKNADLVTSLNTNLPTGLNQFVLGQKANLTDVDFPAFGLSKSVKYSENDLVYLRENRLFVGARPVDGSKPTSVASRTYSLDYDLIDPSQSLNLQIISITLLILAILN